MGDRAQYRNDPEEVIRIALESLQSGLWTAMPGIVTAVNLAESTCTVQPAIRGSVIGEDGVVTPVTLPLLIHVPIVFPGVAGFALTMPLAAGDEVLVVFGCRAIDAWWQSGGVQEPVEARMHDLSDGFAIPAPMSQAKKLANISATGAQLRSTDGARFIEVNATGLRLVGNVTVTGTITASGDVVGAGKSLSTHTHPVTTAPGTTGPPT